MKTYIILLILVLFTFQIALTEDYEIVTLNGDVKIRRGVDEHWQKVSLGILLEDLDTILTGENGEVILKLHNGMKFRLGPNAILDLSDLRKISDQELFLYLTRKKIDNVEKRIEKTPLHLGSVSVVHGTNKNINDENLVIIEKEDITKFIINGIRALYSQELYPNTIIKIHQTMNYTQELKDCGELHFYLGSSFEALNKPGQAIDEYRAVIKAADLENCQNNTWKVMANTGIERLRE
jgi:hypothetical protein